MSASNAIEPVNLEIMERLDEEVIRQEIAGVWSKSLVYQFQDKGGRTVTGLSIRGIEEAARLMVRWHGYNITVEKAAIDQETDKEFRTSCKVVYKTVVGTEMTTFGYSRQSKTYDGGRTNEFAYVQALSKAQRNALRTVIPEKLMAEFLLRFQGNRENVRVINERPAQAASRESQIPQKKEEEMSPKPLAGAGVFLQILRFIQPVDKFIGLDQKEYGPFKAEDIGNIPSVNAEALIKRGVAQAFEKVSTVTAGKGDIAEWGEMKKDGIVYGTVNLNKDGVIEAFFDPFLDKKLQGVDATFTSFLENRVLGAMKKKAEAEKKMFAWNIDEDDDWIKGIQIVGDLTGETVKDLLSPCAWVAKVAADKASQMAAGNPG